MKIIFKSIAFAFLFIATVSLFSFTKNNKPIIKKEKKPKIQAAILLDVSGSMDGLIEQAKAQLWNMVNVMGKAQCDNTTPQIEIALYEYGRSTNRPEDGYVKQLSAFTTDLDLLSKKLFSLTTNGGYEYCGQVIYTSLKELQWDAAPENYKVIFIAGNEDFLQGNLLYTKACDEAKNKGVIVNTIYCGDRMQGIREHWNLSSECGNGSFSVINQNEKIEDIPTPYDSTIIALNDKLNGTYISYGAMGYQQKQMQESVDRMNYSANKSAAIKRATVKSNANLYRNDSWDLVDACAGDEKFIEKLDRKTLPDSLQKKNAEELKKFVLAKKEQRTQLQNQIESISKKREDYISAERKKNATLNKEATLESEVEKIIKLQARKYNMKFN
ncbi:MAG: VWA domain-containing protein [Chitinophagaceae bacterium]|nr:VWA domain-containing protein [Chitinophagaceae bacterium]